MFIELKIEDKTAYVTLNRPEVHNAFNEDFIKELTDQFDYLNHSENVSVIVLKANGKSFCAGADLNWMKKMKDYSKEENILDSKKLAKLFHTINNVSKPVIGVVQGAALGGGSGLVAVCDYVLATNNAEFGFTEVRLGLVPAVISPFVVNKIGESFARATFLNGAKFSAEKALNMGLVHDVCSEDQIQDKLKKLIKTFLEVGPVAQVNAKNLIFKVKGKNPSDVLDYTCELIAERRISKEGQEGMESLLEKRAPNFHGLKN